MHYEGSRRSSSHAVRFFSSLLVSPGRFSILFLVTDGQERRLLRALEGSCTSQLPFSDFRDTTLVENKINPTSLHVWTRHKRRKTLIFAFDRSEGQPRCVRLKAERIRQFLGRLIKAAESCTFSEKADVRKLRIQWSNKIMEASSKKT